MDFKINQLTKELVVVRLRELGDPCAAAAELVKRTLWVALKGMKPGDSRFALVVRDACQGGMTGLLLTDQSLSKGAVSILQGVIELAEELGFDTSLAMQGALTGIAELRKMISEEQLDDIRREVGLFRAEAGAALTAILHFQWPIGSSKTDASSCD